VGLSNFRYIVPLGRFEAKIGPFPRIKSWKIEALPGLLRNIDFQKAEKLEFYGHGSTDALKLKFIPSQLTELYLKGVALDHNSVLGDGKHFMPNLVTLQLGDSCIDGSLPCYITSPNLKNLYLWNLNTRVGNSRSQILADEVFFQGIPNLEYLFLSQMEVDTPFCFNLQNCPSLREICIGTCFIADFVPSFIEILMNGTSLSSLTNMVIDSSWPSEMGLSFMDFARICARHRPGMCVSGNERLY
jgi:hypothetical protein